MEYFFDVWNHFASDGIAVWAAVVRVHLIRITIRSIAVELKINESRCVVGEPHPPEFRAGSHQALNCRVTCAISTDVHPQGPTTVRRSVILRKNDAGPQIDRPPMKSRQQIRLESDVL